MHKNIFLLFITFFSTLACASNLDELRAQRDTLEGKVNSEYREYLEKTKSERAVLQKIKSEIDQQEWDEFYNNNLELLSKIPKDVLLTLTTCYMGIMPWNIKIPVFLLGGLSLEVFLGNDNTKAGIYNLLCNSPLRLGFYIFLYCFMNRARKNEIAREELYKLIRDYCDAKNDMQRDRYLDLIKWFEENPAFYRHYSLSQIKHVPRSIDYYYSDREKKVLINKDNGWDYCLYYHCYRCSANPLVYACSFAEKMEEKEFKKLFLALKPFGFDDVYDKYFKDSKSMTFHLCDSRGAYNHIGAKWDNGSTFLSCYSEDLQQEFLEYKNNLPDVLKNRAYQVTHSRDDLSVNVSEFECWKYEFKKTTYELQNFIEERVSIPAVAFVATNALCAGLLLR